MQAEIVQAEIVHAEVVGAVDPGGAHVGQAVVITDVGDGAPAGPGVGAGGIDWKEKLGVFMRSRNRLVSMAIADALAVMLVLLWLLEDYTDSGIEIYSDVGEPAWSILGLVFFADLALVVAAARVGLIRLVEAVRRVNFMCTIALLLHWFTELILHSSVDADLELSSERGGFHPGIQAFRLVGVVQVVRILRERRSGRR